MKFIRVNYLTFPYKVGTKVRYGSNNFHKFYTDGEIFYIDNETIFVKINDTISSIAIETLDEKYKII